MDTLLTQWPQVYVDHEWSVEWKRELSALDHTEDSACFDVWNTKCYLRFDGRDKCELALSAYDTPPDPFHVTTYLSRETDLFMPQTTTIKSNGYHLIWTREKSEVSKFLSDFRSMSHLCFTVVFHMGRGNRYHEYSVPETDQTSCQRDGTSRLKTLSRDLAKLLDGSSNTDVQLKCGDKTFKAHRNLLSCRSEVFKAMLESEELEGKTGQVVIRDTEADLFEQFLRYLYTGTLPELTAESAVLFYELGDKYAVVGMQVECRDFLTENLSPDNACAMLKLADRHSDQDFRKCVTEYILEKKVPLDEE